MRIEKRMTCYGYDLFIDGIWHKKCLNCKKWYEFNDKMGYCKYCIFQISKDNKSTSPEVV